MSVTIKAGTFLIDLETKKVALVYRERQKDFSFPKGHLEKNETIKECAIRETEEETKTIAKIIDSIEPVVDSYVTPSGENCECYMYVAISGGKSDNTSLDTHETLWISFDEVEEKLSYDSLKKVWNKVKFEIEKLLSK